MLSEFVLKQKDIIKNITFGFLPKSVLVPLCQEKDVFCESLVQPGVRVSEGQVIAECNAVENPDGAKIHSPIPGIVQGIRKCTYPNGKCGDALQISLSGKFSHIGKIPHEFSWEEWGATSLLNRLNAHGVINTFSMREGQSLAANIRALKNSSRPRIFIRLYDEDLSCQTDSVLAFAEFDKIIVAADILHEMLSPCEIVFAYAKSHLEVVKRLSEFKSSLENGERKKIRDADEIQFVAMNEKKFPCGTKYDIASRYKKNMRLSESAREICDTSLFVDSQTLMSLHDAVVHNIPATRVNVNVSGDCLKSSAVLKLCVGTSFKELAQEMGLATENIGKIIVNGYANGFSVPSLETPVTKYVKSVAFISKRDIADYSEAYCIGCGRCRDACPAQIYPDLLFRHLVDSVKVPDDFVRSCALCTECGLCNSVCPTKLPLFQSVKILKEKQNEQKIL